MTEPKRRGRPPNAQREDGGVALSAHERHGLCEEAFWAFDMDQEAVRFDSRGRRWVFVEVRRGEERDLMLKLQVCEMIAEEFIPIAVLKEGYGRPRIEQAVRTLDGLMR